MAITEISKRLAEKDFLLYGWTPIKAPLETNEYRKWLEKGYAGEMRYLHDHVPLKEYPEKLLNSVQSAVFVGANYVPHPKPEDFPLRHSRVALYARGGDYHFWLKEKIEILIGELKNDYPNEDFLSFVDSMPVLERELSFNSGMGWIGKNTCLINEKKGSLFVIGGFLTSLKLPKSFSIAPDRCGTCTRCIDACPTSAIVAPRELDARKCISYLNIEAKSDPPEELREKMGDWLFGCDICQTVCPWNEKAWGEKLREYEDLGGREKQISELKEILGSSNKKLQKKFVGTPLSRAGKKLKRNALIVAANLNFKEVLPEIEKLRSNSEFLEICNWAEKKLLDS